MSEHFKEAVAALDDAAARVHAIDAPRSHNSHRKNVAIHISRAISALETWRLVEQAHAATVERAQRVGQ
jgi:hypothetical protein